MKTRNEFNEEKKRLQVLYPEVRDELMKIPGVVKVGLGVKEIGGTATQDIVFRVYVKEKKSPEAVPSGELIPEEVRGIKTDVVTIQEVNDEVDTSKYRPLKGGSQIKMEGGITVGTLGCFARLASDNSVVLLTNHHVLYAGTATDGSKVGQPQHVHSLCCNLNEVATNVHGIRRDHLDCAIARLNEGITTEGQIHEIGLVTAVADAVPGENVKKRGRTTGLTTGVITNIDYDSTGVKILEIEVKKDNGNIRFSRGGDSGAALLNEDDEIIGLHRAGNNGDDVTPGSFLSVSVGIQEVLEALTGDGFAINIVTGGGDGGSTSVQPTDLTSYATYDPLWSIEQRLKRSRTGTGLWAVIEQNISEVLRLVNDLRPVTVAWHRHQGPAFIASIRRSFREPGYRIPDEINGVKRRLALIHVAGVLEEYASESLKSSIHRYSSWLVDVFSQQDTVESILQAIEREIMVEN